MKKDPKIFIEHILECIGYIKEYTKEKKKEDFLESIWLQDAVIRRIEIIGDAIKNIPEEVKKKYKDIPWKNIVGMRDILIHEYFGIDLDLTWRVVENDIPNLEKEILRIKKELK